MSSLLQKQDWQHYSCDYLIASRFLKPSLPDVTPENLASLSAFVGKPGNPDSGGLSLDEFKRRQRLYYQAECEAVAAVGEAIDATSQNFVHDSTGSFCEITDDVLMEKVGARTLIVYIKSSPEDVEALIERARKYPKPLYFPPAQLEKWLNAYVDENGLVSSAQVEPNDFTRWVFPRLLEARLPKYQDLADRYGVTIPGAEMRRVHTSTDFIKIIQTALGKPNSVPCVNVAPSLHYR